LQWTRQRWQEVLFSDESRSCILNADGRIRVWKRQNERLDACCINEVDRWGGANVMIWALRPLLCVDARYLAGRSLNLDVLETLEQHKEPGFHLYCVVQ
jgi:hypothetical protein